ncbi:hypothetical protein [Novosphingobium sp. ZW T3_23]|uniref:hypothetical protein n=1 Tax=Novosphingobium sp. ZW T3_23 TaxID=3378084 RepID=UPI0038554807
MCATACVEEVDGSNVTVKERGRRANFKNPGRSTFQKIQVDKCLVKDGKKADWIVRKIGVGSIVVELKGKDLDQACRQLLATVEHPDCQPWLQEQKALLIVCSRYPSVDTTVQKVRLAARKRGMRLSVVCDQGDFIFEDVLKG